ncbi:MAG: preprotein translocase subunit SecE [Clostridia bacterium]|nr:preprotein translocase subunit SecE [Clostridia bacterium]
MGSKSKRRHAQKQYNRAQNKPAVSQAADTTVVADTNPVTTNKTTTTTETTPVVMTPKEFRQMEKERAKQEKLARKQQAQKTAGKTKDKKEKRPFFLVRFFKWLWRSIVSVFSELKKVHWPTAKQVFKATGIVLGIVVLFGIVLLSIWILFGLLHYLLVNGSLTGWSVF